MDKVKGLAERHVQWLVLALALLYVAYTVWTYVANQQLVVDLPPAKNVRPGDIDDTIQKTQVEPLQAEIANKTVSAPKVINVLTEFDDRLNERRTEVANMKNPWDAPFRPSDFGPGNGPKIVTGKVDVLPVLPPAIFKSASTRRTVLLAPGRKDTAYWSGKFTIDANALAQAVAAAFNKPGLPPNFFRLEFVSVEALREEQLPNGAWSPPVLIPPLFIMQPAPKDKASNLADMAEMAGFFDFQKNWMDKNQDLIARPPFLKTAPDAEPWIAPGGNPPVAPIPGQPPAAAAAAGAGNPAAVAGGPNPNGGQPNGAFNAMVQPADPTIIVHDVTIEEGKVYRYSVRYKLYNPLFNNKAFAKPDIAATFAILSPDPIQGKDPLAWSGPITVEPSSYVFVTKINQFTGQAWFDIFEWKNGRWHSTPAVQSKPLTAGDPIAGSQGVSKYVLVDVRKESRIADANYGIVMGSNGVLQARNIKDDGADPTYIKLKGQAAVAEAGR